MKLEVFKSSYGYYNLRTIDGKPTEEMSNYLKQNGYYWSRNNNCWYPGTSAAKNTEANEKFVEDFRKKFFEPAEQEQKSFGQELFEREQRKTAWREAHGLETKQEHSEENISSDERITNLETLINELLEERKRDQEKISRLEFELSNNRDEGLADFYSQQEQQQLNDEAEWEKENTLTEEEEQAIIDEHNEIPSEIILDSAEAINTIGEIMEEAAREEEPQAENDFMESSSNEEDPEVEVSPEELSLAKSVLPTSQYVSTLRFSQGEEGNFFKQKLKEIAEVVNKAPKLYETDGAEQHPIVLRYFHPTGTETLVTEIGEDGEAYGFQCLNGDYEMAEWGYLDLNEIKSIRMMEIDYHVEKGMTVERWLYKEQPDMFPQYAKFAEQLEEKSPMDIANETGNDVEAIGKVLNNQNENEIIVDSQQLADELFDKVTNRYYEENKDFFDTYEKVKEAYIENESRYVGDARIRHNFEQYHEELVKMQLQELTDIIKEADSQEIASKAATRYFNAFGADRYSYYGSLYSITKLAHYESGKLIYPTPEELQSFIKETYNDLHGIVEEKEQENIANKPYNFFINDAANLDLGIGAEIEPITGLTAEQAAVKYAELKDKGLSPYIGINIPGDFVFDDKEGQGAGIFTEVNGRPSFYMGDNFVKDLNEYDEHAKNVLAAYKELYEMTDKYILGVERPDFVFEKENEFSENKEYDFTKPINISERFAIDFVNHGYKENTVRFIDRKNNQITTGQYLVSTIADRKGNSELILDMGVSAWTVDADSMKKAEEICRYYRYNHITVTSSFEENVELEQLTSKKDIKAIREQCREILKKTDSEITEADKVILAQYEGAGGLNELNRTNAGILNEFYTPNNLVEKVWQIVDAYAPNAKTVLEPSAGVGKFANNRPNNEFTMHELDETSARINKILHPEANVIYGAYQKQFFDEGERVRLSSYQQPKYDVVIGNPPYGKYNDKYKGLGEGKEFDRYEEYFISKGLDALKDENSIMAFVVPSGFLNNASDKQKEIIASKGKLIDAYRLPVGTFPTTDVGTDIIIMTSWEKDRNEIDLKNQLVGVKAHAQLTNERLKKRQENYLNNLSSGEWFKQHPEKILGEVKTRTNRFGKIEEYVTVHEGLTVQDELNKIDSMLPNLDRQMSVENKQKNEQSNIPVESISKAFAEIYKDSPEKATESTQEFTEALEQMDFHKLGHFMLWGVAGGDEISEPVKAATRNIFENYTGKSFPVFENIDDETEKRHLTQLWLAKNTNVAHIDTWNKCYDLHSEQDVLEYLVSRGSGTQGGKERINKFFEKNLNEQERIKFLINEYGWFGSYGSVFEMQCNNNSKGIKVTAYISNPETEEVTKFDRMVSWKEICNEIKRQRLLEIYLDKPVEKTVSEENDKSQSKEVQQESTKTRLPRAKKEKWNIDKSKGEVMTAQEFSHLYGRDFDEREFPIWAATDWQGNIDLSKLSAEDLTYMEQSGNYVCKQLNKGEPEWTHKVLFTTGDIYAKIQEQRELLAELNTQVADDSTYETQKSIYEKNIALLEASKKEPLDMEHIHFGLKSTLAEEFTIPQFDGDGNEIEVNLQESFILWAQGQTLANRSNWRGYIDFATANISREELGEDISFSDIVQYIDGKPVKADAVRGWRTYRMTDEEKKAEKAERKKEADLKRQARADIANKLFDRYLHEGLEPDTRKKLEDEYNRRFNSYIIPDYSKLPLFVNGMSAYKGDSKFKLYNQQIKGISFLCNKGNGLLAYDVGVGKTAAGIVSTVNQIQTERSKRPLIIVPNQVYSKWYTDIKQLFPNEKVNDLYNFNKQSVEKYIDSENPHKLNIPENSISLCTYEALKNITFTDESCENELYKDFANLLSADMDGSDRENAESSDKIKGIIGSASHVKDESYYFFEECGFDHLTVDEAHNFKNLWVVPRPKKKGESNEYSGIPSGKPSARALKMYGMTQLVQEHNDNRNVFMLTATPFANSPTEVYSMLSYIGRERLHQAGISSLRSFFDQFAQTKQELGVSSNGEIDTKQVMKNWKELPALQNILTEFIDKVDGEEAGIVRPNKFTHVKPLDMSELQHQMREMDEERMAEVKEGNSAAVIVAMNNMRLSCVAPALANPDMYEGLELPPLSQLVETSPKLKFVCDAIIDMYKDNPEKGQFMYIPLGKESHGIIKDYLVQHGIPKEAVEIINGDINNSPEKKEKITSKFNDEKDKLKIIIGGKNTSEGIDLNGNSFVMYNCSLGWNPSETIQAEGRIWRQGNLQGNVHIVYPVMNDSIDSVLYQKHDEKRSRINELWNYKGDSLNVEEINPEDLKLDLIKDPQKKAKLILEEETKDIKSELSKINLKIKDYDEIIEKRKQLSFDFGTVEDNIERYEKMVNDYKDRNLEVPEWVKVTLKNYKKEQDKANYQKENIEKKLTAWNLETEEDEAAYINNLNSQKRDCEDKIAHIVETMPEILQKLEIERMEQKVMEYPVAKQREILESDILNNLRPMKEVEYEIKTERHNKMLAEMLKAGDITKEQHDLYKTAGYEKYEKWLNGEIDSLEEKPVEPSVQSENEQSREAEEKTPAVTDEYGFEVFGEEEPSHTEKTENVNSENKNTSDNSAHTNNSNNQSDNLGDLFSGVDDDDLYIKSPEQQYFNFDSDDKYFSPEQLTQAEQKRDEIVLPILNGKESGMYNAFNTFAKKGLFDVVGTKIDIEEVSSSEPMISSTGWKQLQAAMNIYREKRFESFRYVFIDRDNGEIRDQMAITCHMPNLCTASFDISSEGTINKLIERAEQTNTMIVAVHNHPSGNTEPSYEDNCTTLKLDEELKTSDGKSLFAGHIILDHDTFSTWEPHRVNGWIQSDILEQKGKHDELLKDNFAFAGLSADNTSGLLSIADKINDVNNWNDDFIPVVFTNPQREVTGLKLYDKSFFNKEPQAIRNEFQFSGFEAGASSAFPVLTEDFMNKLGGADRFMFEEKMKDLVLHNAFTDAALPDSTIVQKYDIHAGMSFFTSHDLNKTIPEVKTTWEHRVNPTLYEQLKMGTLKVIQNEELEKKPQQDLSHLKKASGMGY